MSTIDMSFGESRLTVKELLDHPNPVLDLRQTGNPFDATKNATWPLVTLADIEPWDDFTADNIHAAWGNVYNKSLGDGYLNFIQMHFKLAEIAIKHDKIITEEEDYEKIGRKWHENVLITAFEETAPEVQERLKTACPDTLIMDWAPHRVSSTVNKKEEFIMDWAIRFAGEKKRIIVVGETKKSTVFNSDLLRNYCHKNGNLRMTGSWPLHQVAAYAYLADTRYGAITTPEELFLFEFFKKSDDPKRPHFGCRCKVIPMHSPNPEFNADFALWAHGMYALHDNHRGLVFRRDITPLDPLCD